MDLHSFFLLFPSIFMLHELEEILLFPRFMDRNPQLQRRLLSGAFTPFRILRQYIPGVLSGIITAGYCTYQIYDAVLANYMLLAYSFITLLIIFVNIAVSFKILQWIQKTSE